MWSWSLCRLPGAAIMTLAAGALFGLVEGVAPGQHRLDHRRDFGDARGAVRRARLGAQALPARGRGRRQGHREGRRGLSAVAAARPGVPLLPRQSGDGADGDAGRPLRAGDLGRGASGDHRLHLRRDPAGTDRAAERRAVAGAARGIPRARISAAPWQMDRQRRPAASRAWQVPPSQEIRRQSDRHRRRVGRAGGEPGRGAIEGQGRADRARRNGRRLPQHRLRSFEVADPRGAIGGRNSQIVDVWNSPAGAPSVDFAAVMRRLNETIAAIAPNDSVERFQGLGVDVRQGEARLVDPWTVTHRWRRADHARPKSSSRPAPRRWFRRFPGWRKATSPPAKPCGRNSPRWTAHRSKWRCSAPGRSAASWARRCSGWGAR